jgi:hypothetical protein
MTTSELGQRFIDALSAENLKAQRRHEFRQGYQLATEAEIQMLADAGEKDGSPPHSLAQAKQILGIPEPKPKPDYSSIWMSEMAWAQKYWRAAWEDTELALHATDRERRAINLQLSDLPDEGKPAPFMTFCNWDYRPAVLGQDNMPQPKPLPRAKDFDDAALAIAACHRENKLRETLNVALSVLRDDKKPVG